MIPPLYLVDTYRLSHLFLLKALPFCLLGLCILHRTASAKYTYIIIRCKLSFKLKSMIKPNNGYKERLLNQSSFELEMHERSEKMPSALESSKVFKYLVLIVEP